MEISYANKIHNRITKISSLKCESVRIKYRYNVSFYKTIFYKKNFVCDTEIIFSR